MEAGDGATTVVALHLSGERYRYGMKGGMSRGRGGGGGVLMSCMVLALKTIDPRIPTTPPEDGFGSDVLWLTRLLN